MPANASPEFGKAEKKYLEAETDEQRLNALEEMIRHMPQHKSAEKLRANIRTRYKKLRQKLEKKEKQKKISKKQGIKKQGVQIILCGLTNSGKSSLLSKLTNAKTKIDNYQFTTKSPSIGMLDYQGVKFQIIDMPSINHETFDQGIANTADILLIIITNIKEIKEIQDFLKKSTGKKIIVFNKSELLTNKEKRKISETLKSKKYNFILISTKTQEGIEKLKVKLLENSGVIRIYTKEPKKEKSKKPLILPPHSTVKDVAEKIKSGLSNKIKQAKITGPSSKFPHQKIGLKHVLKDKDIVELYVD